jgi:hypothetical protein
MIFFTIFRKCFSSKIKRKHFPENQTIFFFTGKCFPLINFYNAKQTHENLKNNFLKITFHQTNVSKITQS